MRLYGRFNFRAKESTPPSLLDDIHRGLCLVDGREIKGVWYADTHAGIVKTYDVCGDGIFRPTAGAPMQAGGEALPYQPGDFPGREVDCPPDGTISETLRGAVALFSPEPGTANTEEEFNGSD